MKVLVADERGDLAPSCIIFLAYWGHEVAVVRDGLAALRKARAWRPDLIVAPVELGRMDGLTLAAALKAAERSSPAPTAIALAGPRGDEAARRQALAMGAVAYLELPLAVVALAEAVRRVEEARAARPTRRGVA